MDIYVLKLVFYCRVEVILFFFLLSRSSLLRFEIFHFAELFETVVKFIAKLSTKYTIR